MVGVLEITNIKLNLEINGIKNDMFPDCGSIIYQITDCFNSTIYDFARILKINEITLRKELLHTYNGFSPNGAYGCHPRVYFYARTDAERALIWLESLSIAKILTS